MVIRQGLPNFIDPLDEHDLAGLAQLDEVDSRLISLNGNDWEVAQGPIEDFESLCKGYWSLLVQGVDEYLPEACHILDQFNFIPNWRIDDLMVSYSVPNAGVGPHIDQYDVFIVQGKGKRNWKVGAKANYAELLPHPNLKQIEDFEPIIDVILEPGDVIYIPPGFPHNGVALEPCLNYSVGIRAPDQIQLLDRFLEHCMEQNQTSKRYSDPDIQQRQHCAEISQDEMQSLKDLMAQTFNSDHFEKWFLSFNSSLKSEGADEDLFDSVEESITEGTGEMEDTLPISIETLLAAHIIERNPDTHTVFIESEDGTVKFAINGKYQEFQGSQSESDLLKRLLSNRQFKLEQLASLTCENGSSSKINALILELISEGLWEIID